MQRNSGITLIEVLTSIAVIVVVAAILSPAYFEARNSSYRSVALTQARQLNTSLFLYMADNKDLLPPTGDILEGSWMRAVGIYRDSPKRTAPILVSPLFKQTGSQSSYTWIHLSGYALNSCLGPQAAPPDSANTVSIANVGDLWSAHDSAEQRIPTPTLELPAPDVVIHGDPSLPAGSLLRRTAPGGWGAHRFGGKGVYGFMDGSARFYKVNQIRVPTHGDWCGDSAQGDFSHPAGNPSFAWSR